MYRALAQLERDGLVESWPGAPKAGQARRVYGLTDQGERALRAWMGVVKQERDCLDQVLRRYVATGTIDAVLAEAEGGWAAVTGHPWSPVSSTSRIERRQVAFRSATASHRPEPHDCPEDEVVDAADRDEDDLRPTRYRVVPERSVVLIEARSTVGPDHLRCGRRHRAHRGRRPRRRRARRKPPLGRPRDRGRDAALRQRALRRRADAPHRRATPSRGRARPAGCTPIGSTSRYHDRRRGHLPRFARGSSRAPSRCPPRLTASLLVSGEQVFDIRDFDIASPTVLMLRIYPDVVVQLQVEAEPLLDESPDGSEG